MARAEALSMWFKLRLCAQMFVFETFMVILFWRNKTDFRERRMRDIQSPGGGDRAVAQTSLKTTIF